MLTNLSPLRRNATVDGFGDLGDTYVFGIATARRLAELGVESNDNFVAPAFDTSAFNDAILDLGMLIITLGSTFVDVAFAVAGEILTQVFSVLVDSFFFLLRSLMMVLKMLVKSGMLTTVIGIGVDFAIIVPRSGHLNPPYNSLRMHLPRCLPRSFSPRSPSPVSLPPSTCSCASSTSSRPRDGTSN